MTPSEVAELLERVEKRWPHAPLPLGSGDVWLEDLADVGADAAHEAVRAFSRSGEKFPPTSGWVRSEAQRRAQDGPPGFDDLDPSKWLPTRVLLHGGIYSPDGHYSAETAAKAIAVMAVNGCHEAVLRFVAERGLRAVLTMPHGDRYALDPNQMADRRDLARHYRDVSVPGWMRDPRPGLALERACRAIDADPAVVLGEARELCARLEPVTVRQALPPAEPEDGPTIDPRALMDQWKADRAKAQARRDAEAAERRALESEAQRSALAELAEHNRTDGQS
jgi:hypothetical protein